MNPPLKLKELLWEITPKCNKNCTYCGSKAIKHLDQLDEDTLKLFAKLIAAYPPEVVTLTGGEPGLVDFLPGLINILSMKSKVRIISNGTILCRPRKILESLDIIGLSINSLKDIEEIPLKDTHVGSDNALVKFADKITIVTNFGKHNIWDFDKIKDFVIKSGFNAWQIQLTMGDQQLPAEGIRDLWKKIPENISSVRHTTIVRSDNLQPCHSCTAGINACSLTFDGNIVPCLSIRSWNPEGMSSEGDLRKTSLQEIWETKFNKNRFHQTKCCRDFVEYPEDIIPTIQENFDGEFPASDFDDIQPIKTNLLHPFPNGEPSVFTYAAINPMDITYQLPITGNHTDDSGYSFK